MPAPATIRFQPRKTPIQARSQVTVDAILEATLHVLLKLGKDRLTTTAVALRSGVSVGTLYQYFPNKSALLQACLRRHMDGVRQVIEQTCGQHRAESLLEMGDALIAAYLHAKMRHVTESAALYAVSSDVEGAAIAKTSSESSRRAVAEMFRSAREELTKDPDVIATVVLAALNGVARRVLEERHPERHVEALRAELVVLVHAYLRTCAVPV